MELVKNKIALVTASTRGIGLECAKTLAANGAKVYLAVRNLEKGKEIAAGLGNAAVVYFDAGKQETFTSMVQQVAAQEGRLDILVNNFGITDVKVDFDLVNGDSNRFFEILNTNLKSVYLPSKEAVKVMLQTGGGSIINISSVGGLIPDLSRLAYGVSKAAINYLTQNVAVQYAHKNIRCNAVLPGFVETEAALDNLPQSFLDEFVRHVPMGRPGQVQDIAGAVLFFASELSRFVTGQILPVAGGFGLPSPLYAFSMEQMKRMKQTGK